MLRSFTQHEFHQGVQQISHTLWVIACNAHSGVTLQQRDDFLFGTRFLQRL